MSEPLLAVRDLGAGYGEMPVLRGIDFEIREREIVALVGSNAAGKTTLLRALSGVLPHTGQIRFAGEDVGGLPSDRIFALGLVQVPEGRQLFGQMTVQDNLLMGAYRRSGRLDLAQDLERVYTLFPVLKERRRQFAGSMSGGEQQMCAMARALVASPRLLMIDEMSLGLAPAVVDQLLDVLVEIRGQGVTVLLVEQDVFSALRVADRGYVLESGAIVREGSARDLGDDPEVQRAYLGV
ncbi:MAG: ABC transporter ATP-binding protein [Betaproteobacteria bacterium]|nr:ABC transporter ATP-binding protein [Betaproteobacteria bacterium]MDE2208491.1 ABC transporter ATP-binding protein [Betaproteobacteria bacterium]MDE2358824.1 ABC transporter ATP-binding protein [Betaproteobacteria bacterium]